MHYNFTSNLWIEVSYTLFSVINYLNIYLCFSHMLTWKQFESVFVLKIFHDLQIEAQKESTLAI